MTTTPETATLQTIADVFQFTAQQREVLGIGKPARRPAKCRNWEGSALRPEGACNAPAVRVKAVGGTRAYNLCGKCAVTEAEYLVDYIEQGIYTVTPIA